MQNVAQKLKDAETSYAKVDSRKVSNRSALTVPRSILDEIEKEGITTERLTLLSDTYPIYYYKTQVTVHGVFPKGMTGSSFGYKNLVRNKNGSLGIRFSAVDAKKKVTLSKYCREAGLGSYRSSTDFYVFKSFRGPSGAGSYTITKEWILERYKEATLWASGINKDLFSGSVTIAHDPFSGIVYVLIYVNTVLKVDLKPLIENLTGESYRDLQNRIADKEAKREAEYREMVKGQKQREAKTKQEFEAKKAADTRPDFDPSNLKPGTGCMVETYRNFIGSIDVKHWAVYKNSKGELLGYALDSWSRSNPEAHKINTRKRKAAPYYNWVKMGTAVKVIREGLEPVQ